MNNNGCWIFISHSSKDIEKIRLIRNEFEKYGQNPLAFHLKCLNDDTPDNKKELDDLIKREIKARDWFVYCESEAANNSLNVAMERNYVAELNKVKVWHINLNQPIESILEKIYKICCDLQVFISHSAGDHQIAKKIGNALSDQDYSVWIAPECIHPGESYHSIIAHEIKNAAQKGFYLIIITPSTLNSVWVKRELEYAFMNNATIVPILCGDIELNYEFVFYLNRNQLIRLSENPTEKEINDMVRTIDEFMLDKIKRENEKWDMHS